jgi:hypothetical protein
MHHDKFSVSEYRIFETKCLLKSMTNDIKFYLDRLMNEAMNRDF